MEYVILGPTVLPYKNNNNPKMWAVLHQTTLLVRIYFHVLSIEASSISLLDVTIRITYYFINLDSLNNWMVEDNNEESYDIFLKWYIHLYYLDVQL